MSFLGTIISPVASLVGGLGSSAIGAKENAKAVESTNATNLQIARDNNAFNQQMWEENNAYNDPSAQRDRLLKAGVNPYQGDNVASVASKSVEGTMPAPMQAPQPGNAFLQSSPYIANFATQLMNQQLMSSQVRKSDAEASTAEAQAKLASASADKIAGVDTAKAHMEIQNLGYEGRLKSLQSDAQEIQNRVNDVFANPIAKANLAKIQADVAATLANKKLTDAEVFTEVQKAVNLSASTNKINLESKQIKTLLPYLVNQYKLSNIGLENQNTLTGNQVQFENSTTMPNQSFGMRQKAAGLKNAELGVQINGINVDKAAAEKNNIDENSKLVRKQNEFFIINALGHLVPLAAVLPI